MKKNIKFLSGVVITAMIGLSQTAVYVSAQQLAVTAAADQSYEKAQVLYEDELAKVTAAQTLTANESVGKIGDRSYSFYYKTNSENTYLNITNREELLGNWRLIYKVEAKADCKITADVLSGVHAILTDDDGDLSDGRVTLAASSESEGTLNADIKAGQVAYVACHGTNTAAYGIGIFPASKKVNVNLSLSADGAKLPGDAVVTATGFDAENVKCADSVLTFDALSSYSYEITASLSDRTYKGTLEIGENGEYPSVLTMEMQSKTAYVQLPSQFEGKKIMLYRNEDKTPLAYYATIDQNGTAVFEKLPLEKYEVSVPGLKLSEDTFTHTKEGESFNIDAQQASLPSVPRSARADDGKLYVGYSSSGYEGKMFYTLQDALDASEDGQTIVVAPGKYHELVEIDHSVNIIGNPDNVADSEGNTLPVIYYSQNQTSVKPRGFHGDTVMITAEGSSVTLKNLRIENNSEYDMGCEKNATALSTNAKDSKNTVNVDNCEIYATRDTIYTGKAGCEDKWYFDNCKIYGFQDVICGGGSVYLDNCKWILNLDSDARLLVPQCSEKTTVMKAENLTVEVGENFDHSGKTDFKSKVYFGRAWGNKDYSAASTQCIIDGYTDNSGCVDLSIFSGYDKTEAYKTPDTIASANWLVRADKNSPFRSSSPTDDIQIVDMEKTEQGCRIIAKVNSSLVPDTDKVGFEIQRQGEASYELTDTLYRYDGQTYIVMTIKGDIEGAQLRPVINAGGKQIVYSNVLNGAES